MMTFIAMLVCMTLRAEGDEVVEVIGTAVCSRLLVVDFEVGAFATELTLIMVTREHLQPQLLVLRRIKPLPSHWQQDPRLCF